MKLKIFNLLIISLATVELLTLLILVTFMFIGYILGVLRCRRYEKECAKLKAEILKEIETIKTLERIQKIIPDIDKKISYQRQKQIETLETRWKMKP